MKDDPTFDELSGYTLSYADLKQQHDDLLEASRRALPFIETTPHGRRAAAELATVIQNCEAHE